MATRGNIGVTLNEMSPAPAGAATPKVIFKSTDGIMLCYGTTKPTDASAGYAKGCIFIHVDGSGRADMIYVNDGSNTSCDFDSAHARQEFSYQVEDLDAGGDIVARPIFRCGPAATLVSKALRPAWTTATRRLSP